MQSLKFSPSVQQLLCCPVCRSKLNMEENQFRCSNSECAIIFPIVDGIPVLINEDVSVFPIAGFLARKDTTFELNRSKIKDTIYRLIPNISLNVKAKQNYAHFARLFHGLPARPRILIVGGSIIGQGMEPIINNPSLELTETDVSFGPRTSLICDAHSIPFEDESFDGVIIQAVLEHVVDPYRCVEEVHRVLKKHGVVYAETPFMQQVHAGRYDFTRFTHLGHRRLFRKFDEIESGAQCGPGMALAWAYQSFLLSFTTSLAIRRFLFVFARLTSFYLKYFDYYLVHKAGALDTASAFYFIGRKEGNTLSDQELITLYRGAM